MTLRYNLRLILVFSVVFSLATISGSLSSSFHLPSLQLGHALPEPTCLSSPGPGPIGPPNFSQCWYPAGPAMNTLQALVFTSSTAEYTSLQLGQIDFTDSPCLPSVCSSLIQSQNFLVTAPIAEAGYYEMQYLLANSFWGCNFQFGNSLCGIQIRQGIAHMIDKPLFCANSVVQSTCAALDNPVPTSSSGGLPSPNPCSYDSSFLQTGSSCVVGATGGTAYHLNNATGADGYAWLYAPGSKDLNAAAQHFVNAGLAIGFNTTTSVLTGLSSTTSQVVSIWIRNDDPARLQLGQSLTAEICYIFTGSYSQSCSPYVSTVLGPGTSFPGFATCNPGVGTCPGGINLNWWIYTAAFSDVAFFDDSLYFTYNSRFVDPACTNPGTTSCSAQQIGGGFCSNQSTNTASPGDYMYLCNPNYDNLSSQMETSPCLKSAGDPAPGQPNNGPGGDCTSTIQLSAISAGIQAEAAFGAGAFTLPVFERTIQFGFANNGWIRDINDVQIGLPNYFTWLDAYNPNPPMSGAIRLGFSQTTTSVNPFIARTQQDMIIVGSVYDSLYQPNPLSTSQQINWMSIGSSQLSNSSLGYTAPAHTVTTYRFFLRPDLFFQDGRPVTAYDAAFSYLSMVGSGALLGSGAASLTGVTVLGAHELDIGVNSIGPFVLDKLTTLPILPARYWTGAGRSAWDNGIMACTSAAGCSISQYTLSGSTVNCSMNCSQFSASLMTVNPSQLAPTYDPIYNHALVGSGPWECGSVTSSGSGQCTPIGIQNPAPFGGSYTLTRFGSGLPPASSVTGIYFRSSGDLALAIWSEENDVSPILPLSAVMLCFGQPVNYAGSCNHWQQGIGASMTGVVGVNQISIVLIRYDLNWVSPFEAASNPPFGMAVFPPVLFEGPVTLNPSTVVGCNQPVLGSNNGYDC